jgi:hypothetical protein
MSEPHEHGAPAHLEEAADVDLGPDEAPEDPDGLDDDVVEVDVVEVDVVAVEVLEVDAETAYAARDALVADELAGSDADDADAADADDADARLDEALDGLDAGDGEVRAEAGAREGHLPSGPGELPLLIAARERFSSLDDVPVTGDARVDAATARLDELPDLPTADHVAVYDDVHQRLQDALADADPR